MGSPAPTSAPPGPTAGKSPWPATARPARRRHRCRPAATCHRPAAAARRRRRRPAPNQRCLTRAKYRCRTARHPREPPRRSVHPTPARPATPDRKSPTWPARWSRPARVPAPWPPPRPWRTGPRCCRPPHRSPRERRRRTAPVRPGSRTPAATRRFCPARSPRIAVVPPLRAQSRTNSRAANCSSVTVATTCESLRVLDRGTFGH